MTCASNNDFPASYLITIIVDHSEEVSLSAAVVYGLQIILYCNIAKPTVCGFKTRDFHPVLTTYQKELFPSFRVNSLSCVCFFYCR